MLNRLAENSCSQGLIEDFSEVCPEGRLTASPELRSPNFQVMQFRHHRRELTVPPLSTVLVMMGLSTIANVSARVNGRNFSRPLREGEAVIIPPRTPSEWRCPDGEAYDMLHIYLQPDFLSRAAERIGVDLAQPVIETEFGVRDAHIRHLGMSLRQELESASWAGKAYADLLATALAVHLIRRRAVEDTCAQNYSGGLPKYKLRRAVEYIGDRLGEELKVAEIAEEVSMSPYHFTRLFKQATGLAPHQYIMLERIERAKRLLVETELPIAQVALETGFQSQSRFTTLFRQMIGTTPRAYRGQHTSFVASPHTVRRALAPRDEGWYLNVA